MKNANLGRRIGAMIYDGLLVFALLLFGTAPFVALREAGLIGSSILPQQLALGVIIYLFFVVYWTRYSRTLGMQAWGLRIETLAGERPSYRQCSIRFFAALVSWLPFAAGFWWQLFDREGCSWHDRLSGTRLRHCPRKK